ncbi:hypothetical protein P12x_000909 [Tundrisphaera lichenicola]|uniref:hypothetical protein n=1 Tax=Tundrisphaera lichenicola TaxID=2029860 RepID=UPI003EBAE238
MIVSEARREANRRNALKSTGPKTEEGKARSRANALKHGLCSSIVVHEDFATVQARSDSYFNTLKPQNRFHAWLVDQVAVLSLRIDRCVRIERRVRDKIALRAELTWDDDEKLKAEILGGQIEKRPGEVVEGLGRTPQGCLWMMTRWAMLAHAADVKGCWTPDQTTLAFNLLGTPKEFREGHRPGASLDLEGKVIEGPDDPAVVARREIAALKERRELVSDLDEVEQFLRSSDLTDDSDPELKRLRRYESSLHRRLRWCLSQLRYESPHRAPNPDLYPKWEAVREDPPEPESKPREHWQRKAPHPPFCLEPDEIPEPGEELDVPRVLASRLEKRMMKAEARRDARRRKVERLRA